jgi:hypothetical protein
MTFTGTLIEDLMATVERAERKARAEGALPAEALSVESLTAESLGAESLAIDAWLVCTQENRDYDSKFIGVA